jgi:Bacterial regulatory helix-turn-helix protein, lysR family
MEVRQLHTFCVLAEELNFTRAAERVHTVQSNVTSQIKSSLLRPATVFCLMQRRHWRRWSRAIAR